MFQNRRNVVRGFSGGEKEWFEEARLLAAEILIKIIITLRYIKVTEVKSTMF